MPVNVLDIYFYDSFKVLSLYTPKIVVIIHDVLSLRFPTCLRLTHLCDWTFNTKTYSKCDKLI